MKKEKIDKTPLSFKHTMDKKSFKKLIRIYVYPFYVFLNNLLITKNKFKKFNPDLILKNQRGNDYASHRKRVNKNKKIRDSIILILGVGTGNDIESWLIYKPKKIICVDLFSYQNAWDELSHNFSKKYTTEIVFHQGLIEHMPFLDSDSIDIVASDAVFEHLQNLNDCLIEIKRVLKKGGVLYSTFGPLWYCYGGDHISGNDDIKNGFNHLILNKKEYLSYLDSFGEYNHDENDGRTWIKNNLFSYLKTSEYLELLQKHDLKKKHLTLILEPKVFVFKRDNNSIFNELSNSHSIENLFISGVSIIYEK
jgi:SAM-dependent methyltransferase